MLEFLVLRGRQVRARDPHLEPVVELRGAVEIQSVDLGGRGVFRYGREGGGIEDLDLQVFVTVVESRKVCRVGVGRRLHADLVRIDLLGIRRRGVRRTRGRRRRQLAGNDTGLETLAISEVGVEVGGELVLQRGPRRRRVPGPVAVLRKFPDIIASLRVQGVAAQAHAGDGGELIGNLVGTLAKNRRGVGDDGRVVGEPSVIVRVVLALIVIETEEPGDVAESRPLLRREVEFLTDCLVARYHDSIDANKSGGACGRRVGGRDGDADIHARLVEPGQRGERAGRELDGRLEACAFDVSPGTGRVPLVSEMPGLRAGQNRPRVLAGHAHAILRHGLLPEFILMLAVERRAENLHTVGRFPQHLAANDRGLDLSLALPVHIVGRESVRAVVRRGHPRRQVIRDRGQRTAQIAVYIIVPRGPHRITLVSAGTHVDVAGGRERRIPRIDGNRAARCVAPEQGALGSLQNLDISHVRQIEDGARLRRLIHPVEVDRDWRAGADGRHVGVHAADVGLDPRALIRPYETRHGGRQVTCTLDAVFLQIVGRQRRDGHRHVLQTLAALLCGDDDLVERGAGLVCRRGSRGRRLCIGNRGKTRQQRSRYENPGAHRREGHVHSILL